MFLVVLTDKILMPWYVGRSSEIEVPDVVSMDWTKAKELLEKHELQTDKKLRYEPDSRNDIVLSQSPEPGYKVKPGRLIHLVVSQNQLMVAVPSVRLSTVRDAQFTLESVGLRIGSLDSMPTRLYPEGIVIEQSVEPNQRVEAGSALNLVISQSDDTSKVRVPYLVGRSLSEAKSILADLRLRVGRVDRAYDANLLPGTVLKQSIDSVETIAQRTAIDVVVSSTSREDER